jgi:hypothetical protein
VIGACAIVSGDELGWFDFPSDECTNIWASKIPDVRPAYFGFGIGASWAEQWVKAPHVSPATYESSVQIGDTAVFSGTIARYTVDEKRFPHWITIYLRDSPDGAFVVCSPYRSRRRCVRVRAGSVRVVESGMFHIK